MSRFAIGRFCYFRVAAMLVAISIFADAPPQRPVGNPSGEQAIGYLEQTVNWYRHLKVEEQLATDPKDVLFLDDDRKIAGQVLRIAFDFARADAHLVSNQNLPAAAQKTASGAGGNQARLQAEAEADSDVQQAKAELDSLKKKLPAARGARHREVQSAIDETQSKLELAQTRSQTIRDILHFASMPESAGAGGNLLARIDELQRSVPEIAAGAALRPQANAASSNTSAALAGTKRAQPSGILNIGTDLFALTRKLHTLDQTARLTTDLSQSLQKLRAPLIGNLRSIAQQGEQLSKRPDSNNPAQLEQQKQQLDAFRSSFQQNASLVVPLTKQADLLDAYQGNLNHWRSAVTNEYVVELRNLLLRVLVFGIVVTAVLSLASIWRRAIFRYIHDPRRRYQFLLLRRIVLWFAIGITVAFALASEIGSIATFAGLITAGIAVAMQNVILAIAGYFFLIGKYGVKVGDRIQISGVTGTVVDLGLIRLHLMEVEGTGASRQPTGRVVVFSNAVVFQPNASFFKQIPGTNFVWHEVTLTLAPESNYRLAEQRMLGAVEAVYTRYRESIERQHRQIEQTLNFEVDVPKPQSQLRLTQTGLEVVIHYPVELEHASDIDDQITRELLRAIEEAPELKLVGSATPNIQPVTNGNKESRPPLKVA